MVREKQLLIDLFQRCGKARPPHVARRGGLPLPSPPPSPLPGGARVPRQLWLLVWLRTR